MPDDASGAAAFGAPGIEPRWTSSSKEGVGTAYSDASRVWFTISHGILNEVYYPSIDRPQIRDLQFLVTDGATFFHEEKRDLECEISALADETLGYRVSMRDRHGRYRIVKEIIADPVRACVLVRARLEADPLWRERLQVYALLAPHIEVCGRGNSARRQRAAGKEVLVAWRAGTWLALGVSTRFLATSCGYVGASDGWQDLRDGYRMDWTFPEALDGNVAVMGRIDPGPDGEFTLGLAFGDRLHAATTALTQSLAVPYAQQRKAFVAQWHTVRLPEADLQRHAGDGGHLARTSHALLLAHEDKTFKGAFIASASIPWGEAKGDEDLGGYHLVWTRDMVQSATALLACGNVETPRRALVYLAVSQHADGGFAQNFWLDGTPYWQGMQLDEVAFPLILAWRVWKLGALADFDPLPMVRSGAGFLLREGPTTAQERWEEAAGYSPSTLAAAIAALVCAADLLRARGLAREAAYLEEHADFIESNVERWTVTTQGELVPGIPRHYIRITPAVPGDPAPEEDPDHAWLALANRPPGEPWRFAARNVVDAGFLELVRYGVRAAGGDLMEDSLRVIDAVLKVDTPFGPCWRRYNHDGYGNRPDGGPFTGWGRGRAWPLLTGERAHYELAAGRDVAGYVRALEGFGGRGALLPEQVWDEDRPDDGMRLGMPTGAAMPLAWAHAEYLRLLRSVRDGAVFDRIEPVAERYLARRGRSDLEVWKPSRHAQRVARGATLRIQAPGPFRLRWTRDEWQTANDTVAADSGLGVRYVDLAIAPGQAAPIRFTFYWPEAIDAGSFHRDSATWEGRDYSVAVA